MIPYGKQDISLSDIKEVTKILKSDFITQGSTVPKFEHAINNYCGSNYSVAVNSATSALHIACLSLGLKKDDFLWTSPISFVASANCALYCGASVDFVDICPNTFNICPNKLEQKLIKAKKNNVLPKIIIPVHLAGQSCDMEKIFILGKKYGFKIIEDASHAIGGKYKDLAIGSCKFSDITIFSFHPVKIVTTGEGGIAITNKKKIYEKLLMLRSHGIIKDPNLMSGKIDGEWYYQQIDLGFNYRLTDIQASLGISQLKRVDEFVKKRNKIALYYNKHLSNLPLKLPFVKKQNYSSFHLYIIRIDRSLVKTSHKDFFSNLRKNKIGVNLHYIPIHYHPYFKKLGFKKGQFPEAEKYYKEAISIPIFPKLKQNELNYIVKTITMALIK